MNAPRGLRPTPARPPGPDAAGHATAQDAAQPGDAHEAQGTADPAQDATQGPTQSTDRQSAAGRAAYAEHDVLRDLLNDPFARRVFEDIYSELNRQQTAPPPQPDAEPPPARRPEPRSAAKATRLHRANLLGRPPADAAAGGVTGLVKGWAAPPDRRRTKPDPARRPSGPGQTDPSADPPGFFRRTANR